MKFKKILFIFILSFLNKKLLSVDFPKDYPYSAVIDFQGASGQRASVKLSEFEPGSKVEAILKYIARDWKTDPKYLELIIGGEPVSSGLSISDFYNQYKKYGQPYSIHILKPTV